MTSYFPLLPNIKLANNKKIKGSLTFLNYPNNILKKNTRYIEKKTLNIGIYKLKNNLWELIDIRECQLRNFITISREDLTVQDRLMVVCVVRKDRNFPKKCEYLPTSHSLRVDDSFVEERASYNFTYNDSSTSYQGEYPCSMAKIRNGSFMSFDILKSGMQSKGVENFLLLMNLNISAKFQSEIIVNAYDPENKDYSKQLKAKQNSISVFNLNYLDEKISSKITFFCSNNCTFIPLFLSLDKNNDQMSFEHTHPPADLFIGSDKFKVVKIMKKKWML